MPEHPLLPSLPSRACRGRDQDHQGVPVLSSFPALAGGSVPEDATALWGNPHRSQMAPDSSSLPQAVGAGAGAGQQGASDGEMDGEGFGDGEDVVGSNMVMDDGH